MELKQLAAWTVLLLIPWQLLHLHIANSAFDRSLSHDKTSPFISDFPSGYLNVHPALPKRCTLIRFRGHAENYTVEEAIQVLQDRYVSQPGPRALKLGIMFMENVEMFFPVRIRETGNNYHLFHAIEFLVLAYAELQKLSSALPRHAGLGDCGHATLAQGSPSISVPWLFSPYMSPSEICGGSHNLNCLIAGLIFEAAANSSFAQRKGVVGLQSMEDYPFNFTNHKEKAVKHRLEIAPTEHDYRFADGADGVLLIERFGCNMGGINKPWATYIETFPAYEWHSDILKGLGVPMTENKSNKLVVGYIDRQNTDRHLPEEHHEWLVAYLSQHEQVELMQLHMEDYSGLKQIEVASKLDMIIGMHGNGLTHQLWMTPRRYVVEFYWKYNFQYDYPTAGQLLQHHYLGILNGRVIDRAKVARRDLELRRHPTRKEAQHANTTESMENFEQHAKPAIQQFVEEAIRTLQYE